MCMHVYITVLLGNISYIYWSSQENRLSAEGITEVGGVFKRGCEGKLKDGDYRSTMVNECAGDKSGTAYKCKTTNGWLLSLYQ